MFYSITGKVIHTAPGAVVIETGGVGYRLTVSGRTLGYAAEGAARGDVRLYTYLSVREDGVELFGFRDEAELDLYRKLVSVSGVGPRMGIAILSALSPEEIATAVGGGDYKMLTRAQGVGKRTAERIILELRDKLGGIPEAAGDGETGAVYAPQDPGKASDAESTLTVLGYGRAEIAAALRGIDMQSMSLEDIIKAALKKLM